MFVGASTNPCKDTRGFSAGSFTDLPWKHFRNSKLSCEIVIGLQQSHATQTSTSGVNILANAVLNTYRGNNGANQTSLTCGLSGPLSITSTVQENAKVLTVTPGAA